MTGNPVEKIEVRRCHSSVDSCEAIKLRRSMRVAMPKIICLFSIVPLDPESAEYIERQ